jgi:hypothetical protein
MGLPAPRLTRRAASCAVFAQSCDLITDRAPALNGECWGDGSYAQNNLPLHPNGTAAGAASAAGRAAAPATFGLTCQTLPGHDPKKVCQTMMWKAPARPRCFGPFATPFRPFQTPLRPFETPLRPRGADTAAGTKESGGVWRAHELSATNLMPRRAGGSRTTPGLIDSVGRQIVSAGSYHSCAITIDDAGQVGSPAQSVRNRAGQKRRSARKSTEPDPSFLRHCRQLCAPSAPLVVP